MNPSSSTRPTTSGKGGFQTPTRLPTGSSGGTAILGRPASRGIWTSHQGVGLNPATSLIDRPMTQHGLGGLKTGSKPSQRTVQDKTYFLGLLRGKINDLNREITTISRESEILARERSAHKSYDQKASELALDIKTLQEELMAYNMVIDKMTTNTEFEDMRKEQQHLKQQNDQLSLLVDDLFGNRQQKEAEIVKLEAELKEVSRNTIQYS